MITIKSGFNQENQHRAAKLYSEAFKMKFAKVLGNSEKVQTLFQEGLNPKLSFGAFNQNDELVGILGYYEGEKSLIDPKISDFIKAFGVFKGIIKAFLAHILFYVNTSNKDQLFIEGIAVEKDYQGQGVGTLLIEKLVEFAKTKKYKSIKLDVIDENSRAKALYNRIGFVEREHKKLSFLTAYILSIKGFTTMEKPLE